MDVGLELRQARERRGVSLQQISNTTKISPRVLQAIETCDVARLPAPVFTRGFVKSYAAEVGLNPDETMRRYLAQFETPEPPLADGTEQDAERSAIPPPPVEKSHRSPARILQGRFGAVAMIALVGVTALALIGDRYGDHPAQLPQAPVSAAGLAPVENPAPVPVATSGTTPAPADALHIAIAPTGACWVSASIGEQKLFATLLNAGEKKAIDTPSDVTLRVGDPSTCAFTINGKPARLAGPAGQPATVRITRQNYAQFLPR